MLNLIISRHVGTHWRHRTLKIGQCAWMGPRGWEGSFGMLAHNATRVVICPRWVITNLRPRLSPDEVSSTAGHRPLARKRDPLTSSWTAAVKTCARANQHEPSSDLVISVRSKKKKKKRRGRKTHRPGEWHGRQIYVAWTSFHDGQPSFHFSEMDPETLTHWWASMCPASVELEFLGSSRRLIGLMGVDPAVT